MAKATQLVKAYLSETIPPDGGFIVSGFFEGSQYSIYEVTAYRNVKDIYRDKDGIIFKTDGNRTHLMVEPPTFAQKHIEPVNREEGRAIPYRFNELEILNGRKSEKIMIAKEPVLLRSSFTILDHGRDNFAFMFHLSDDVYVAIKRFVADSLYNDCNLSKKGALEAATKLLDTIKKFTVFQP